MKKTKKFVNIIALLLTIVVLFGCAGCTSRITKERQRIFKQINTTLIRNTQYKFVCDTYYLDENGKTLFRDIVAERLKKDGKDVKSLENFGTVRFQNNTMSFNFQYKQEKKWFSNDVKYFYAVGLINLTDYSVSSYYFQNEHKSMPYVALTRTHLIKYTRANNEGTHDCIIINLETNEIEEKKNVARNAIVQESFGEELTSYEPSTIYSVNGVDYAVYRNCLIDDKGNEIPVPTYKYVKERNEELRKIDEILDGVQDDDVAAYFLTNGEELFVGYASAGAGFGILANLYFTNPVIFKCDLSFENFEYIACLDDVGVYSFDRELEIIKIQK